MIITWSNCTTTLCVLRSLVMDLWIRLQAKVMLWALTLQLSAAAQNVTPQTILLLWILTRVSWCVDIVGLWILLRSSANGIMHPNSYYWVALVCAGKPCLITILTTLVKKCGALMEKVCLLSVVTCGWGYKTVKSDSCAPLVAPCCSSTD